MKLIEIKKIAKQTNYRIKRSECELTLFRDVGNDGVILNKILIDLSKKSLLFINNMFCDEKDLQMIKATVEFAETPPEDREEEKKFYLRHKYLRSVGGSVQYLTIHTSFNFALLKPRIFSNKTKQQFTREEIEKIKEKFDTDLKDFKEDEVKDEDED